MRNNCVFDLKKECPVRKSMSNKFKINDKLKQIIKPLSKDEGMLRTVMPMVETLQDILHSEFSNLHYYCEICRVSVEG